MGERMGHVNTDNFHIKTRDIRNAGISLFVITLLLVWAIPAYADAPASSDNVSTYIVVFNDSQGISTQAAYGSMADSVLSLGGNVKYRYNIINGMAITIPDSQLGPISELPNVKYVEKDQQAHLMLMDAVPQIGANTVWASGYTGSGVKVCIIDTGINASHPDLNGGKVANWADFVYGQNTTPYDYLGHGTHVAGIVAGTGAASNGTVKGVAPNATLMCAQVFNLSTGLANYSDIIRALDWAVDNHAQVISMSLGGPDDQGMNDTINYTIARGVTVVVAAGNSGPGPNTILCPGDNPNVITVGAVDKSDNIASYSSRGPNRDGSIKPDVTNVGTNIYSANASSNGYRYMSGTSMATPMTAGVVALMLQKNPSLTPAQVKYILERTAKPMGGSQPNNDYGWGRVWANGSVDNASYSTLAFNISSYNVNENAGTVTIKVTKSGNNMFPATVNYATADGTAHSGVNYQAQTGTLSFQPADTYKTFTVNIINDGIPTTQKYFNVSLSSPANATITAPVSGQVFINNVNLNAVFTSNVTVGMLPLTVQFNDTTANSPTAWDWNFGDGTGNATTRNVTHIYHSPGLFNVVLTAKNGTETCTASGKITVLSAGLNYPPALNGSSGSVVGRVTTYVNGTIGVGGAYVAIVNASNISEEYANTTTDANGNYVFYGVNASYGSIHHIGPHGQTGADYILGINMYEICADKSPYGIGLSNSFGIDADVIGTATTSVILFTKPARIDLSAIRGNVSADGTDNITIAVTAYDVLGNPVVDGYNLNITVGNDTNNAWNGGFQWTDNNGSLQAPGQRDAAIVTSNNTGSNNVTFGWVPPAMVGNNSTIWVYYADNTSVFAKLKINFNNTSISLKNYTYELVPDWNLISVPLDVSNNSIDAFFPADVKSEIVDLWGWNSTSQKWTYYSPDPNTPFKGYEPITAMETGKAYWANMNSSANFSIQGEYPHGVPNATIPLVSDWNFVGLTGMTPVASSIMYPTSVDVWGWNSSVQKWTYYSPDPNTPFVGYEPLTIVKPGLGQWVNM